MFWLFAKHHTDSKQKLTEETINKMIDSDVATERAKKIGVCDKVAKLIRRYIFFGKSIWIAKLSVTSFIASIDLPMS